MFAGLFFVILAWFVAGGAIGYVIGKSKDRAGLGFLLGLLLGWIGWIIVAVMEPSEQERIRRQQEMARSMVAAGSALLDAQAPGASHSAGGSGDGDRPCPWCAELIKHAAIVCRFCGRDVPRSDPPPLPPPKPTVIRRITVDRWLPDPLGGNHERLWNGTQWTPHVRSATDGYRSEDDPRLAGLPAPTEPQAV